MRDAAERQKGHGTVIARQRRLEKAPAGDDLRAGWLVLRRHAAHRIGDERAPQAQAVLRIGTVIAAGQPELQQCGVEQIAGIIAGERASSAVGSTQSRRQPDDDEARRGIAPIVHRSIEPVGEFLSVFGAECREPWAQRTVMGRIVFRHGDAGL